MTTVHKWAEISSCGRYRYFLGRSWEGFRDERPVMIFAMLNPSTADDKEDDATITRVH